MARKSQNGKSVDPAAKLKKTKDTPKAATKRAPALRRRAEEALKQKSQQSGKLPRADMPGLLHELQVHQIELEIQNDELRRTQLELEEARDKYLNLFDFAPVGYLTFNQQSVILDANITVAKMLGMERTDLVQKKLTTFIFKQDQDNFYLHRIALFETAKPQAFELRLVKADGSLFYARVEAMLTQDEGSAPIAHISFSNITAQKHAEAALQTSQASLQSFYDSVPFMMGIAELDGDKTVAISVNRTTADFLARQLEDIAGQTGEALGNPADFERMWVESYQRCQHAGVPVRFEYEYLHASGRRWLDITTAFIQLGSTGKPQFSFVAQDVTERKHAEKALQEMNQTLEQRVAERTAELLVSNGKLKEEITERKSAEQALAEANAKLEKLFEVLPVGISVLNHEGKVVKQNPMLENILGISAEGLARGDYGQWQYIHPDGTLLPASEFPSARILQGEAMVQDVEIGVVKEEGQTIWTYVSAAAVPFSDWKAVIATRDFTERKRAEEALRESEQRFETIFERSPLAIGISRMANNCFVDVNSAMCTLFGYSREEMIGHTSHELELWANPQDRQRMIEQLRKQTHVHGFETINRQKSGKLIDILISAQIVRINNEEYLLGQIIDITERKRAEEALRLSAAQFRTLTDSIQDIFFAFDQDLRYTYWNKASETLTGIPSEQAIGKSLFEIFADMPETRRAEKAYREVLNTGVTQSIVTEYTLQGMTSFYEISVYPFAGGLSVFTRDVTAERRMRRDLEQSHARLQALSRQLIEAQENERRAIGRELHDEIGQTLTGLKILLELSLRLPLDESRQKITQAQQAAGELIDRVSALSLDLRPAILDDMGLLPALLWFTNRYAAQTNIHVHFEHQGLEGKRFASVIETAAYRLIQESLTNVARHARVNESVVQVIAEDTAIKLFIEDAGQGFDVLSVQGRKDASGLNGMRERVHLLEGNLEIISAPRQGTRISIRLPLMPVRKINNED